MHPKQLLLSCLTAIALTGCATTPADPPPPPDEPDVILDDPTCVRCGWLLDEEALIHSQRLAHDGDADAAFRVALHFSSADDYPQHLAWMRRAAMLEHAAAQYNVWFSLRESKTCSDQLEALAWLQRSAEQGFGAAKQRLRAYQQRVSACQ